MTPRAPGSSAELAPALLYKYESPFLSNSLPHQHQHQHQKSKASTLFPALHFTFIIMQFFLKNIALFSLLAIMVSATSKFANTCRNIEGYGSALTAECQEYENGQLRETSIDLNRCLKNNKGSLKCGSK